MCANFLKLGEEIDAFHQSGADILHLDLMDGYYVDNFGLGIQDITHICRYTKLPIEIHLMIANPERHIDKFINYNISTIYFHPDTTIHPVHLIERIKSYGIKAGIVLSPGISIESVSQLLYVCDYVMCMMINPGFSGNTYLDFVEEKVKAVCLMKNRFNYEISLDGAISQEVIQKFYSLGVSRFVLGTKILFIKDKNYRETISEIRNQTVSQNSEVNANVHLSISEKLNRIKLVASDCDGVLTDGGLYYGEQGDIVKKFNVLDGVAFIKLKEHGIKTAIITGETNPLLMKRAEKLKVDYLITGNLDKLTALMELCRKNDISIDEAAYIGDDIFDKDAIKKCGWGCAPSSAIEAVRMIADYITVKGGGNGCFREMADMIIVSKSRN
jgi:ribulose-phosphate 3-epimerase